MPRRLPVLALIAAAAVVAPLAACSSDDDEDGTAASDSTSTTATADRPVERPDGPAATIEGPLTGGNGPFTASGTAAVMPAGWVEEEYVAAGTATSYRAEGELPADGTFELTERDTAEYRTRVIVRRPADATEHNGTVVVEWLNVSAGLDANPDWSYAADELVRGGYAWVGVSAQRIGVEGGDVAVRVDVAEAAGIAGQGLRNLDPERYGSLSHPGDAYAYDIFTQVGRAVRAGDGPLLGDLEAARVLAVGESQSGMALTTYVNGVQPLALAYDGFLVHSRGLAGTPLGEPGEGIDIVSTLGGSPTRIRTDLTVPVLTLETETDLVGVMNFQSARQPDTDLFRTWEIAGTAHADAYQLGPLADAIGCSTPINRGPHHFVVKAALRHLDTWVRTGAAPPAAEPIEVGPDLAVVRDADGIAIGGIRTPVVDVPTAVLSGDPGPDASVICLLMGSTTPLPPARIAELYPSSEEYLQGFTESADAAVEAGFVLADDRAALLAEADPAAVSG